MDEGDCVATKHANVLDAHVGEGGAATVLTRLTKEVLAVAPCMEELSNAPHRTSWVDWQRSTTKRFWHRPGRDFTPEEVEAMVGLGAQPVHLGALRLRTETAGMAAVAQFGREG